MKKTLPASRRLRTFTRMAVGLWLLAGGCSRKTEVASTPPSNQPTEQRWIIGAITEDLANLAAFAAGPDHWTPLPTGAVDLHANPGGEPGRSYALTLRLPGGGEPIQSDLELTGSAWSPELYVPTLRALFARLKLSPPATTDTDQTLSDAGLLQVLSTPLTAQIEEQNQRLSDRLQTHPLDARAHAQAALLLGTLALRENSGLLWNPRGLCNRAVAHLTMARALSPDPSECGDVAELLVGLVIDTKADCQKRIAALQKRVGAHPELGPWATAAALRNTRDYRLLANSKDATLLERLELFRALSEAISDNQAIRRVENLQPNTAPDWERIVLQAGFGVEAGHQFALPSVGLEMNDAALVFPDAPTASTPDRFAAIFNLPPGGPVQTDDDQHAHIHVIDRGTWAQFFQRHLLQASDQTYNFLQNIWGVPDEAKSFRVQIVSALKRLTLYPLCLDVLGREDGDSLYASAADLLSQHPEWVSDGAWAGVVKNVPAQYAKGGSWALVNHAWFSPRLPVGTAYGFDYRSTDAGNILAPPGLPELEKIHDIAPLKYSVCWSYAVARAPGHHLTFERVQPLLGSLSSYYLPAIWGEVWLVQDNPAQYGELMNRAGTLDPTYYLTLGAYYVQHRMEPEAAQAYQNAIDQGADSVAVSSDCGWLVNYYYDHGQRDRALSIAQEAAEVYSAKGLETMAHLLERMDRIKDAESYYEKLDERYNEAGPLHSFYVRSASAHPEYLEKMKAAEGETFPRGMEEVALAQLSGKPTKGVLVRGENALSRAAGLQSGAIIVGIDGKRVRSMEQYSFVRALKDSPELDLLVYQSGRYQEVHAHVPGRMFNLDFTSWP